MREAHVCIFLRYVIILCTDAFCLLVYVCTTNVFAAWGARKRAQNLLKLQLRMDVSRLVNVGMECKLSVRASSAVNHRTISPGLRKTDLITSISLNHRSLHHIHNIRL